jgi:preprotein translocase subunit SecE
MNRETKRLLKKQEIAAEREKARTAPMTRQQAINKRRARAVDGEREGRLKRWRRFLKEVRHELKKVAWPSRGEVLTYTVVVLVSVLFFTAYVFLLDYGFGNTILELFKTSSPA